MIFLKELYLNLPTVLKKQIVLHTGIAILSIVLFIIIAIFFADLIFAIPCIIIGGFAIVKGVILFYNCIERNSLEINGVCYDVEITGFRKKVKSVTIKTEDKFLKLLVHYRLKNIHVGDNLTVYMSNKTQLFYTEGTYITGNYYAITVEKEE